MLHQLAQVQAAALVAQPAGDPDVPILVEVVEQLLASAREAMHHRRADLPVELLHDRHEIRVRVALVQEQRLAGVGGDLQLHLERTSLRGARRKIAEVIQAAFAHRDHFGQCLQRTHFRVAFGGVFGRMVRMHARGGEQFAWMRTCEFGGHGGMRAARAGDDHARHARRARALQHGVAVVVEAVVGEVGADVDEHGRQFTGPAP